MILLKNYFINTSENIDVISIIHEVNRAVREAGIPEGLVTISVPDPGAAVTILEPLPDIVAQFKDALGIFPDAGMAKNRRKEEISIGPRVIAAMLGKSLQIPMSGGRLVLAPREEVVLIDLEKSGRRREFHVQVIGDAPESGPGCPKAAPKRA